MFEILRPSVTKVFLVVLTLSGSIPIRGQIRSTPAIDTEKAGEIVRSEFLHAWQGYKKYAWGHDDLRPLSKTHHDWYGQPLLMTPVDALDTMLIMGLKDEADLTREYIAT